MLCLEALRSQGLTSFVQAGVMTALWPSGKNKRTGVRPTPDIDSDCEGWMNDAFLGTRRRWPAFIAGVIVALIVAGLFHSGLVFKRGMASWGKPVVVSDEAVRSRIAGCGVDLPVSAHHLYHAIAGFMDHTEFIAFSTAPSDAMPTALAFAQRATNAPFFTPGAKSKYGFINDGPGSLGPEWATQLWDISAVTNGQVFEIRQLFILVDAEKSRVYIARWSE